MKPDFLINLAGAKHAPEGEYDTWKTFSINTLGTKNLLDACKKTSVKNFIFSSTAAIYKEGQYKVSEKSIIKPKSIYGKTKIRAENLIKNFANKNKINYGILRYFNIAGSSPSGKIGEIEKSYGHLIKNLAIQSIKLRPKVDIFGNKI